MTRWLGLAALVGLVGCGDSKDGDLSSSESIITLNVSDGASDVSIARRVTAEISRDDATAQGCRFTMAQTSFEVTQNGAPVAGELVFFVGGLRVDFTPTGLFDYSAIYNVNVDLDCTEAAKATFSTSADPGLTPTLAAGDAFKVDTLSISEPGGIAPIIEGSLEDSELTFTLMEYDGNSMRVLGAEGEVVDETVTPIKRNAFVFMAEGTLKWPFFQLQGSLEIPVEDNAIVTLNRFEFGGRFVGNTPYVEMTSGVIRANSPCAEVCAVEDSQIQAVCARPDELCDELGNLNLVGSYEAPPNPLGTYQTIDLDVANQVDIPTTATLHATFSRGVPSGTNAVMFQVRNPQGELVDGTATQDDNFNATWEPAAPLAPNTEYTVLVIALSALETSFVTGN